MQITSLLFILILSVSLLLLVFMILKLQFHPVLALFIVSILLGLGLGNSVLDSLDLINVGFGDTLSSIGITIILGSILAMGIQDIRAADSIAYFFEKLFRGKRLELAPALTAFIVSIPVFGDITMILLAPIASRLAYLKNISMSTMVAFTGLGLFLTHGLVPPTPGILAISIDLKANLGTVVTWGVITSIIAFFGTWLVLKEWIAKEIILPDPKFSLDKNKTMKSPSFFLAILPIIIPVVFIASHSITNVVLQEGTSLYNLFNILGDKVIALLSGVLIVIILGYLYKYNVYDSAVNISNDEALDKDTSLHKIIFYTWVKRALFVAILPLLITAMSGSLANVIGSNEQVNEIANDIASMNILPILIPYLISAILMGSLGSMTTVALTAAAVTSPMLPILELSAEIVALSIGAGTLALNHLNNSGFWILTQFYNISTNQGLKYVSVPSLVGSVFSILILIIINSLGII